MPFSTVALTGATGNLGVHLARGLIRRKELKVKVLTRAETLISKKDLLDEFKAGGAEVVAVDFSSQESLVAALQGVQVLISSTSGRALLEQLPLVDAAKAAGVKRFYPSEFGVDHVTYPGAKHPLTDMKKQVSKLAVDAGLEVVLATTGFFAEWAMSPFYTVDHAASTVEIVGDGNTPVGHYPLKQLGEVIAESINHPALQGGDKKEYHLGAQGLIATWNEILDAHEQATGSKWKRTYVPVEEAKKRVAANGKPFDDFGTYLRIWQAEGFSLSPDNLASKFSVAVPSFADLFKK